MTEKRMRHQVTKLLEPICAFAVENPVHPGTPEVCTTYGWLELKMGTWPKRTGSPVRVKLRKEQRIWLRKWFALGGSAWTFTWMDGDGDWFLHPGVWSAQHLGRVCEQSFRDAAILSTKGIPHYRAMIETLRANRNS